MTQKQSLCLTSYNQALVTGKKLCVLTSAVLIVGSPVVNSCTSDIAEYIYLKDVVFSSTTRTSS